MDVMMRIAVLFFIVATGLTVGCSDDEPAQIEPEGSCVEIDCEEGLFCRDGECRCDETSCGEGHSCEQGEYCVEDSTARCEWGSKWVESEGCRCDPEVCEDEPNWRCGADDERCVRGEPTDGCIDDAADWQGDEEIFVDRSEEAGLVEMGVEGVRLAAGDVTDSGVPELFVRRPLAGADDFSDDERRESWLLENQGDGTFEDVTQSSGLVQTRYGDDEDVGRPVEVVALADVDNSGAVDVVTLASDLEGDNPEGAEVMLNDGDGNFELGPVSEPLHAGGEVTSRTGAAFLDVDRDGVLDLWIGNGAPPGGQPDQDRLLQGDGSGGFEPVTQQRGLETVATEMPAVLNAAEGHTNTWSVAACDLDDNHREELLAASYGRLPNHLWDARIDDEATSYINRSIESGYGYDDNRMDWTDNESARCWCSLNPDDQECADVPEPEHIPCDGPGDAFRWNHDTDREPYRLGGNSGTTVCADIGNDGNLDLLTTEIAHWDVGSSSDRSEILYNDGQSPVGFERRGNEATGLERPRDDAQTVWDEGHITAAALDFDNSGRLDILIASTDYPGTRAHLYHQQPDGTFEYVPVDLGIDLTSAHGIAVADFDASGALDVAIGHSRARCDSGDHCLDESHVRLFDNQVGADNNWLQLDLEGTEGTNRSAIGARITVAVDDRLQTARVDGGHGHYGMQHGLIQHFGLGDACSAKVVVEWPDRQRTRQVFRLSANERYRLVQGELPEPVEE